MSSSLVSVHLLSVSDKWLIVSLSNENYYKMVVYTFNTFNTFNTDNELIETDDKKMYFHSSKI